MKWAASDTVVVPVDFSEESWAAVDEALELVRDASHLHLIHVLPVLAANDPAVVWEGISEATATRNVKKHIEERLQDPKYSGCHTVVRFGSPGIEIADFAQEIGADLIVIPSHGRTGLKRLLIGSVAEGVVRHSHCPVLVLRNGPTG